MLVSQADFARMKKVTRPAVTQWKRQGRLAMIGNMVHVEATEERLQAEPRSRAKRRTKINLGANSMVVKLAYDRKLKRASLSADELPDLARIWVALIASGSADLIVLLLRHGMPESDIKRLVGTWVAKQRRGACEVLDHELDPPGCISWAEAPAFTKPWEADLKAPWPELAAEAATEMPR